MKESRIFYRERKSGKFTQLENVSKVLKWVNQVFIYKPRSSGHLASSKRSSRGFFIKKSGKNTISHNCAKWKVHQHHFHLLRAFRMIVRNFRVVMRNQFSLLPFELQPKSSPSSFRTFMRNWKTWFFNFFLPFLPFLSLDSTSITSKSTPNPGPNQLHYFFHCAFGSSSILFVLFNLIHLFCH